MNDLKTVRDELLFIADGCLVPPDGGTPDIYDAMASAKRALIALSRMIETPDPQGWDKIESAPKDGTEILLALWSGHPEHKTSFCWAINGHYKDGFFYSKDPMIGKLASPTHWQHITAPTPAATEKVDLDSDYHKLCAQLWDALGITEYTGKHISEHIRDLVEQNKNYKKEFNIGDIVQVSPNYEYFEDWKREKLEIVGIYRAKPIGYSTPNEIPPIKYSVKDIKDNWSYGFTDDFDGDDLIPTQED